MEGVGFPLHMLESWNSAVEAARVSIAYRKMLISERRHRRVTIAVLSSVIKSLENDRGEEGEGEEDEGDREESPLDVAKLNVANLLNDKYEPPNEHSELNTFTSKTDAFVKLIGELQEFAKAYKLKLERGDGVPIYMYSPENSYLLDTIFRRGEGYIYTLFEDTAEHADKLSKPRQLAEEIKTYLTPLDLLKSAPPDSVEIIVDAMYLMYTFKEFGDLASNAQTSAKAAMAQLLSALDSIYIKRPRNITMKFIFDNPLSRPRAKHVESCVNRISKLMKGRPYVSPCIYAYTSLFEALARQTPKGVTLEMYIAPGESDQWLTQCAIEDSPQHGGIFWVAGDASIAADLIQATMSKIPSVEVEKQKYFFLPVDMKDGKVTQTPVAVENLAAALIHRFKEPSNITYEAGQCLLEAMGRMKNFSSRVLGKRDDENNETVLTNIKDIRQKWVGWGRDLHVQEHLVRVEHYGAGVVCRAFMCAKEKNDEFIRGDDPQDGILIAPHTNEILSENDTDAYVAREGVLVAMFGAGLMLAAMKGGLFYSRITLRAGGFQAIQGMNDLTKADIGSLENALQSTTTPQGATPVPGAVGATQQTNMLGSPYTAPPGGLAPNLLNFVMDCFFGSRDPAH